MNTFLNKIRFNRTLEYFRYIRDKINKKVETNILFYIAYTMIIFSFMFANVKGIQNLKNVITNIAYLLLICICALKIHTYPKKIVTILSVYTIVFFISWRISNSNSLILLLLLIFASKDIDFNKLILYDIKIKVLFLFVVLFMYGLGFTDNYTMIRNDIVRSSMGFGHPNTFAAYIFSICCEYIYLRFSKIKIYEYIFLIIIVLVTDTFCDSRGTLYSILLLLLVSIIFNFKKIKILKAIESKVIKYLFMSIFIVMTILSFTTAVQYDNGNRFVKDLNSKLSGRIKYSSYFYNNYDLKVFGNELELISSREARENDAKSLILDNAYLKIILQYGWLTYILFAIGFVVVIAHAYNKKDYILCVIFSIYALRGFIGNILFYLYGNIFLLYITNIIFDKLEDKEKGGIIHATNPKCN